MTLHYRDEQVTLHHGDALEICRQLESESADCIVTSPPYYGLRDYGTPGQYGLEETPAAYVETMRALFAEMRRVLADEGTLWLNLGDSYSSGTGTRNVGLNERWGNAAGSRKQEHDNQGRTPTAGVAPKNLLGIPWRVAFALQDDGWILRNAIVWNKPNGMPESVTDRLSNRYEQVFLFTKSPRYWFDLDAIRVEYQGDRTPSRTARTGATNKPNSLSTPWRADPTPYADGSPQTLKAATGKRHECADRGGKNPGDVWTIPTQPFPGAHFAVMPARLATNCIVAGCKPGGTVLDPFNGSGTTGQAAQRAGRRYIGVDLNAAYLDLTMRERLNQAAIDFGEGA